MFQAGTGFTGFRLLKETRCLEELKKIFRDSQGHLPVRKHIAYFSASSSMNTVTAVV